MSQTLKHPLSTDAKDSEIVYRKRLIEEIEQRLTDRRRRYMKSVRALSIDGGGIRGIIPLTVLEYIEDQTGRPIHELFDVMGGTSTGGIISLGLNSKLPKKDQFYTARDLLQIYSLDANYLFQVENSTIDDKILNVLREMLGLLPPDHGPGFTASEYSAQSIENFLQNKFGDTKMSALPPTPDVTVFSYDIDNACPYYFNSNKSRDGILKGSDEDDYYVWQAARATSAAPTFFPAADFSKPGQKPRVFVDGGIFINNPTLELLIRAKELYPQSPSILLVSLGTGEFSKSYSNLKKAGVQDWIWLGAPLLNVMMSSVSAAINEQLEKIKEQFPGLTYQRYQKRFENDIGMDDIKPEIIAKLQQLGEDLVAENQKQLDELCRELTGSISKPESTKKAWLNIKYGRDVQRHTSGGWNNKVTVYQPVHKQGWFWVGQCAQGDAQQPYERMLLVNPLEPEAVKPPIDFKKVWDNNFMTSTDYASCWRPIPPEGYVALGYFLRLGARNYEKPSGEEIEGLVCVHQSLVTAAEIKIDKSIWNDRGSGAGVPDYSIWRIKPKAGTIDPGTFYGVAGHNPPSTAEVYCLSADKVNVQWS
ncbi:MULTISPECIES: patatin-like phospholipase family protein [Aerosakkonema]|uniref:patatin-like phospholipase family protein n=1 Tax=Aerosakkonema TaxID=1246629 RepID=UPI0035B98374